MGKTVGYSDPTFIVEKNGKFYLTLGVLEYDPVTAKGNLTLETGVNAVARAFKGGTSKYQATEVVFGMHTAAAQTGPRPLSHVSYAQTFIEPEE